MRVNCKCGAILRGESKALGECLKCRTPERLGPCRLLCPGDWLESPDGVLRAGFVWEVNGDDIEVRSYDGNGRNIKHMTRAEACWYRIVPNDRYGEARPLLEVAR